MNDLFSNTEELLDFLTTGQHKKVLTVIPAISVGSPDLNNQYQDYLDNAAKLYTQLTGKHFAVRMFVLGANHRGDGFLHKIGKNYLIDKYNIPSDEIVWEDNKFKDVGYCSVEEAKLTSQFLLHSDTKYQVITCICQSQLSRYKLHQKGYGIDTVYFVILDKPNYYPLVNQKEEEILLEITQKDPKWETEIGRKLINIAHQLRDPNFPALSKDQMDSLLKQMKSDGIRV